MTYATITGDAASPAPTGGAAEASNGALHLTEVLRANSEAFVQAWSTTVLGALSTQEHMLRFFGDRLQKDLDLVRSLAGPQTYQQMLDRQAAYGRTLVEDYIQESQTILASALEIVRDGAKPVEERTGERAGETAEEAPEEFRQAGLRQAVAS
jgi:hypothetical protein